MKKPIPLADYVKILRVAGFPVTYWQILNLAKQGSLPGSEQIEFLNKKVWVVNNPNYVPPHLKLRVGSDYVTMKDILRTYDVGRNRAHQIIRGTKDIPGVDKVALDTCQRHFYNKNQVKNVMDIRKIPMKEEL